MGINEIDYTIQPYTVGRDDCTVLPRSFTTLAEAEAYLAVQDKDALTRGEFYLDGPEENRVAVGARHLSPPAARGVLTPDIEGLCRALEAQQRD